VTRTSLKTNNDPQNTTQRTKDPVTRRSLKTNNDPQNTTQRTKDPVTRRSLKTGNEFRCSETLTIATNPEKSHEWGNNQEVDYGFCFVVHNYNSYRYRNILVLNKII
jgi:hypothetical protein